MGWSSGLYVATDVLSAVEKHVPPGQMQEDLLRDLFFALERADWDTQDEVAELSPLAYKVLKRMHPEWDW